MTTIVIAGDLVLDHHLLKQPQGPSSYVSSTDVVRAYQSAGGAWYLTRIVRSIFADQQVQIIGPPLAPSWAASHIYTIWSK